MSENDTYKSLTGTLYELSDTDKTGMYQMELDDGNAVLVFFQPDREVPPLGELLVLSIINIPRPDGSFLASGIVPCFTLLKGQPNGAN